MSEWKNIQFCWRKKKNSFTERHMFSLPQCKFHMYIMLKWEKKKRENLCICQSRNAEEKLWGTSMIQWLRLRASTAGVTVLNPGHREDTTCQPEWPKKLNKWVKTLLIKSIRNAEKLVTMPLPFFLSRCSWQSMEGSRTQKVLLSLPVTYYIFLFDFSTVFI